MAGKILSAILLVIVCSSANAQNKISADEIVRLTLERHPEVKSAALQAEKNRQLEKSAINIPNPEILMESPTGNYQTLGVMQSFDFPTVYAKQRAIAKQKTTAGKISSNLSRSEVAAQVRLTYLEAQYFQKLKDLLRERDSIYSAMSNAAIRKFEAGETDAMTVSFARMQQSEVARLYNQSLSDYEAAIQTLQVFAGLNGALEIEPMKEIMASSGLENDSVGMNSSLLMQMAESNKVLSEKQLSLERNRALPGLVVGYLNQAGSNTPADMRIRAGITLPLWWWQYSGNIKAAKTQIEIAEQESELRKQQLAIQLNKLRNDHRKFKTSLNYFETEGLQQNQVMMNNSKRLFEAGSIDYISHLRNMNDAYQQQAIYLETVRDLNKTVIQLNYITSK